MSPKLAISCIVCRSKRESTNIQWLTMQFIALSWILSKTTNIYLTSYFLASLLMGPSSLKWLLGGPWGSASVAPPCWADSAGPCFHLGTIPLLDLLFSSTLGLSELKGRVSHFSVLAQNLLRWNHKQKLHFKKLKPQHSKDPVSIWWN